MSATDCPNRFPAPIPGHPSPSQAPPPVPPRDPPTRHMLQPLMTRDLAMRA
jgi:hypothetical protein